MKKQIQTLFVAALCFVSFCSTAQQITEANYLRADSALWMGYEQASMQRHQQMQADPARKDSLIRLSQQALDEALQENIRLALRYAATPSGLQRIFMVRIDLPKSPLDSVYRALPDTMKTAYYGTLLRKWIDSEQVAVGTSYVDVAGTMLKNKSAADSAGAAFEPVPFRLSSLAGKKILLLFGGLDCMGSYGREYLKELYAATSREEFEIVVYWPVPSVERLQAVQAQFPSQYTQFSDFLTEASPMKINYPAQGTPTCFLIDKSGIVQAIFTGVHSDRINPFVSE